MAVLAHVPSDIPLPRLFGSVLNLEAMRILTIEFPGYKRPGDYENVNQKDYFNKQVEVYASVIEKISLGDYFVEEDGLGNTNVAATMSR